MTDFTLDEYYGIPEEELRQILQAEAKKMFNSDSLENDSEEVVNFMIFGVIACCLANLFISIVSNP